MRGVEQGSRVRVGAGAMLCAGSRLDMLVPSDADPMLVRVCGWLGQFEEASSASELTGNGGERGFSRKEKEKVRKKRKREKKKEKNDFDLFGFSSS